MDQRDIINKNCFDYKTNKPNEKILEAVKILITEIGDDPNREGLQRTPLRVARAFNEWFGGYSKNPEDVLNRTFPSEGYNDMAVIKNIEFDSHCEHHITPFSGFAHIGIIYKDKVAGLDKFVKLVDIYARRLQTQEVMTKQIGDAIKKVLDPTGIIIVIEAKHNCVGSRETKNKTTSFITTYRDGSFKDDPTIENRFLQYIRN